MTICLLDIPSNIIHRDSSEGKNQTEREAALELQRRRHVVTNEEPEENKAEEISDLRKKVKSLTSDLDFYHKSSSQAHIRC